MTDHLTEEQLNGFVDEDFSELEASPLRRHLEGCTECREEILALRHLRSEALALPRGLAPGRDLWSGIRGAIEAGPGSRPHLLSLPRRVEAARSHPLRQYWMSLASAAAALVVLTSAVTMVLLRPAASGKDSRVLLPRVSASAQSAALETGGGDFRHGPGTASYEKAAADLLELFNERKSELQPATVAAVETNLRIVDEALRRAREALAADPANADLKTMMTATWQRKVDLLDKAVRLTSDL